MKSTLELIQDELLDLLLSDRCVGIFGVGYFLEGEPDGTVLVREGENGSVRFRIRVEEVK